MRSILLFLASIFVTWIFAIPVPENTVLQTAEHWLESTTTTDYQVNNYEIVTDSLCTPCLYKINFNPTGFVVITADDRCYPILGYGEVGSITNANPAVEDMINQYRNTIINIVSDNLSNYQTQQVWSDILLNTTNYRDSLQLPGFEPEWTQKTPYNDLCPYFDYGVGSFQPGRSDVGCVATAFAQIINYFRVWEYQFTNINDYHSEKYITPHTYEVDIDDDGSINYFPNFDSLNVYMGNVNNKFCTNTLLDNEDKAALCFASGVLLHMNYTPYASGADMLIDGQRAYTDISYSSTTALYSNNYEVWKQIIISELNSNRPIQYGSSGSPGHSYVIYGYDNRQDDDYFKINWGWGGIGAAENSFWRLNNLTSVSSSYSLSNQKMIYNIKPVSHLHQYVQLSDNAIPTGIQINLTNIITNETYGPYLSNDVGLFDFLIDAGTYDITISYNGYGSVILNNVVLTYGLNSLSTNSTPITLYKIYSVSFQVIYNNGSNQQGNETDLEIYDLVTNQSYYFTSDSNGIFNITFPSSCSVDYVVKKHVDNNQYEWYQCLDNPQTNDMFFPATIVLDINIDKVIMVPEDYLSIQDAINHIQDTGTVLIQNGNFIVSGLNWKYKHIKLQGQSINGVTFDNDDWVSAIKLDWSGINNQDIIQNINFTNCLFNQAYDSRGPALALYNGASPQINSCNFTDNINQNSINSPDFSNAYGVGGAVYVEGIINQLNTPKFYNCNFSNNKTNEANGGGAVALYGRALFQGCIFTNNRTEYYNEIQGSGGAILIYTRDYSGDITFNACQFINNKSVIAAHDVFIAKCDNMTQIKFDGCTFSWSPTHYYNSLPSIKFLPDSGVWNQHSNLVIENSKFASCDLGVLYFNDYQGGNGLTFSGNIVANNCAQYCNGNGYGVYLKYHLNALSNPANFEFNNNTVTNINGYGLILYEGADYIINNSVFENCSTAGISWNQGDSNNITESLTINYCLFTESTPRYDFPITTNPLTEYSVQSVPSIHLDANYSPIWNAEVKSLCIDSGNPDLDNDGISWYDDPDDQDLDGTRTNIGAFLQEDGHNNGAIELKSNEVWNWICIPAIDYPGGPRGTDHIDYVFDTYQNAGLFNNTPIGRILNQIKWLYNSEMGSVIWNQNNELFVFPLETHHVRAQYGYKINLDTTNPILPEITPVEYTGYLPGGTGNEVYGSVIEPPIPDPDICFYNDLTQTWERETWLGYYKEASLEPFDAFAPILQNIVAIKAQEWSLHRDIVDGQYTDVWWGRITPEAPSPIAINYGEMVAVRYIGEEQAEFIWGDTYPIPPEYPRYERPEPEFFVFEKKEDYLPVYATLDFSNIPPENEPVEIAIYVDGECVGAEKINSDEVQIKAYLDTDDMAQFHDKIIEFEIYSPCKNENQTIKKFAIQNPITNLYEIRNSIPENCQNYMKVSLKLDDIESAQTPVLTSLGNNYPNPFNPETTIRFDIAKSGKAKLEIFNIKGQLIKALVNGEMEAGFHSIKWNGRDENGRQASSGVYFYRLTAGGKSLTNKMLMLK